MKVKRPHPKKRKLHECYQNLEQAKASGNQFQIKIWTSIIAKLEAEQEEYQKNRSINSKES